MIKGFADIKMETRINALKTRIAKLEQENTKLKEIEKSLLLSLEEEAKTSKEARIKLIDKL